MFTLFPIAPREVLEMANKPVGYMPPSVDIQIPPIIKAAARGAVTGGVAGAVGGARLFGGPGVLPGGGVGAVSGAVYNTMDYLLTDHPEQQNATPNPIPTSR